jgi:hypothetical protein
MPRVHPDTELLDWLDTFGASVDRDPATGLFAVRSTEPDYRPGVGRTVRDAVRRAVLSSRVVDAAKRLPEVTRR